MEPPTTGHAGGSLVSPGASRIALPIGGAGEGIFASMTGPGQSGPPTGSSSSGGAGGAADGHKREVFSDFRRFVSFGLRKDNSTGPS